MAASREHVSDGSSSEDECEIEKFKEATWSFSTASGKHDTVDPDSKDKPSRRFNASEHDHDGNELHTTPEFRAHVAKKLGFMLEGYISEKCDARSQETPRPQPEEEDDNEGFRLFSTSIPATQNLTPPAPRHPVPSSSDSDSEMEMRLKEAAVSVADFLPALAPPHMPEPSSSPAAVPTENQRKKKKKKKKRKRQVKEREGNGALEEGSGEHIRKRIQMEEEEGQSCNGGRNMAGVCGVRDGKGGSPVTSESTSPRAEIPARRRKKKRKRKAVPE